jgi:hypothetical protein
MSSKKESTFENQIINRLDIIADRLLEISREFKRTNDRIEEEIKDSKRAEIDND